LRTGLGIAAALCGVVVLASAAERGSESVCRFAATQTGTVAEVVDGDTIRLDSGMVVRLAAIEAPKRLASRSKDDPWPLAAGRFLGELALGKRVEIARIGGDRYGRIHGDVRLPDGRWLQRALIAAGLARVRPLAGENACVEALLADEAGARRAATGLWGSPDYAVRAADDPSLLERSGLYEVVEGRVLSIGHGSRLVFIDFGRDFRRDFTVMVSDAVARLLNETGRTVESLKGRVVRVRGVIENSGGPAIRLSDPIELELVDEGDVGGEGE
jgi:endonuclease YncB( thermonuclease family)